MRIAKNSAELEVITNALEDCIRMNAHAEISEEEYRKKYDSLYSKHVRVSTRLKKLETEKAEDLSTAVALKKTLDILQDCGDAPYSFSLPLWNACVDKVVVYDDCRLEFHMFGGMVFDVGL